MNPTSMPNATPSMMLPANLLRGGQTSPGQILGQNPLATGMSPSAMGQQPGLQPPPTEPGVNQGMPMMPQPGTAQPNAGIPGQQQQEPQISEAQYILNALADRLKHHSKITEKTVSTLSNMIQSQLPDQSQGGEA